MSHSSLIRLLFLAPEWTGPGQLKELHRVHSVSTDLARSAFAVAREIRSPCHTISAVNLGRRRTL